MTPTPPLAVTMIPIDRVTVANPRIRNARVFQEIVDNIAAIGLKRPITVSRRGGDGAEARYDLVCGQGRLEAYRLLGQSAIPAVVIDADPEDGLIMSLVENCARRKHRAIDLLRDIERLKGAGYSDAEIARKTGLSADYVRDIARLIARGEQRLLRAIESGRIPLSIAVEIAESEMQDVLQKAYERNLLRGKKLMAAKRVVDERQRLGKGLRTVAPRPSPVVSSRALVRLYEDETARKRRFVRMADATKERLSFIMAALAALLADEAFVALLHAEGLDHLPGNLAGRLQTLPEVVS